MRRWVYAGVWCAASTLWLVWAFPRMHPAAFLNLQRDRDEYLALARAVAAGQGADLNGWHGYAEVETQKKNLQLRDAMPNDPVARALPVDEVKTAFVPPGGGTAASVTLRPDGTPLDWELTAPKTDTRTDGRAAAEAALWQIAGADASRFEAVSKGVAEHEGTSFSWERNGGLTGSKVRVEIKVKNGRAFQASTEFTYPDQFEKHYEGFPVTSFSIGLAWFVLVFVMAWISILREGAGNAARAMRDWPVIRLSAAVALMMMASTFIDWDDAVVSAPNDVRGVTEILGVIVGGLFLGLMAYLVLSVAILTVRQHPAKLRGLRLLPTSHFFSRTVAKEVLGGWLIAPVLVSIPLLCSLLLRLHVLGAYDGELLHWPALSCFSEAANQETVAVLALLGIMIPTALRFQRRVWVSRGIVAVCAFLTFAMLTVPFPQMPVANLLPAAMAAAMFLWVYTEFGVLGAITAFTLARPITVVGVLLIQPASGLHSPGFLILGVLGAMGILAFIGVRLAPEPAIVLPGETGARAQARTRREELISEFNVARSAQQQMLPSRPPVLPGYTLSASCEPAREVGGDLYDFLSLGDGRWGIGVADVSGKGVPAALYMTLTKGLLCAASQDSGDPREILKSVNLHLREVARRKVFVTMALGVLDPEARTLEYARAGHNPVVWRRAAQGETRLLSSNGIGLGISSHPLFARTLASEKIELGPGDALVFYSDGLTEAMDKSLEQFGEERLIAAVESADGANAEATRDSILKAVRSFLNGIHPQDDLTIAVLRVNTELENGR